MYTHLSTRKPLNLVVTTLQWPLWLSTPRHTGDQKVCAACSLFHPLPHKATPLLSTWAELLSVLVNEGASCHLRCWMSPKVLADGCHSSWGCS